MRFALRLAPVLPSPTITSHPNRRRRHVAVGPRSPIAYNAAAQPTARLVLRLAPVLPSPTMVRRMMKRAGMLRLAPVLPSPTMCRWRGHCWLGCGWPPFSHRLQWIGGDGYGGDCCGWPPFSHRLQSGSERPRRRLRCGWPPFSHRLQCTTTTACGRCSCGWPPFSHRLQCAAAAAATPVAVGPRSPIAYN